MLYRENKLIEAMNINDEDMAIKMYNEIFVKILNLHPESHIPLRIVKNYLISLNGVIAANYYKKPVCKKMLFNVKLNFMYKIDRCRTLEELRLLGENIIHFYLRDLKPKNSITNNPTIKNAIEYIHNHLDKELTLEDVAKNVFVSSTYLSHLFTKCADVTFSQYVIEARIQKAKYLLSNTNLSILDIALDCGFNSQSYFSNVFKKLEGITPKKYREEF